MKDLIRRRLDKVRKEFGYFPEKIEIIEDPKIESMAIDMERFNIIYNKKFVEKHIKCLDDLLRHEVGHFAWVPENIEKHVLLDFILYSHGKRIGDKRLQNEVFRKVIINFFNDVKVNTRILYRHPDTKIDEIYRDVKNKEDIIKIHKALQARIASIFGLAKDFGIKEKDLSEKLKEKLEHLLRKINWLDIDKDGVINYIPDGNTLSRQLILYYEILKDILPKDPKKMPSLIDSIGIPQDKIPSVMRRILEKNDKVDPKDVRDYLRDIYKKIKKARSGGKDKTSELQKASKDVYAGIINRYKIKILPTLLRCGGGIEISGFDVWTPCKPLENLYLIGPTGPIILPGITPIVKYDRGSEEIKRMSIPDLLIVLDVSGSMTNPIEEISKAVVSAGVIAKNYIENGRDVGIVLFSDTTSFHGYFKSLDGVLDHIILYEGGGTVLNLDILLNAIRESKYELDVVVISDFYIRKVIKNGMDFYRDRAIQEIVNTLNNEKIVKRAYLFFVNRSFRRSFRENGKVGIYVINNWSDISNIVIKNL